MLTASLVDKSTGKVCAELPIPFELKTGQRKYKEMQHNAQLLELCDAERPMPPHTYDTRGVWIDLPSKLRNALTEQGHMFARGGLHATRIHIDDEQARWGAAGEAADASSAAPAG